VRQSLHRTDAIRLISQAREAVCERSRLQAFVDDYAAGSVFEALLDAYAGVSNGFLSQACEAISGTRYLVVGDPEIRYKCPCCNRLTLSEEYNQEAGTGYDVCDYCGWEDDGTTDDSVISSVNHGTMCEYRERVADEANEACCEKWLWSGAKAP
jgi:hypothetical protein